MSEQVPPDEKEPDPASEEVVWVGETDHGPQIIFPDDDIGGSVPAEDPLPAPAAEAPPQPPPKAAAAPPQASGAPAAALPTPASQSVLPPRVATTGEKERSSCQVPLKYSRGMFCLLFHPMIQKLSKPVIHRSHRFQKR